MMDGMIKVSPEQLSQAASEFGTKAGTVSTLTAEMTNLVTGLASAWEGDASAQYIGKFRGLDDDIQKISKMIQEHSKDLEEMSKSYMDAEKINVDEANNLSSDVIV